MIAVIGKSGQVAQALARVFGDRCVLLGRPEFDLQNFDKVLSKLTELAPTALINAAAYTAVDKAETDVESASYLNTQMPAELSQYCAEKKIPFIHYSTDYVFDGGGTKAWTEESSPAPLGVYGETKLEGEKAVVKNGGTFAILRTSWVFSEVGNNFVKTMLRLGCEKENLSVVSDQMGSPTYARDLALVTREILLALRPERSGIYHCSGFGVTSWKEFAEEIFRQGRVLRFPLKVQSVDGILSKDYKTAAVRPLNSRLDNSKLKKVFGIQLPQWQESLNICLRKIHEGQ